MENKRTIELINGALDGELQAEEQMEFNTLMVESEDARHYKESLDRMVEQLDRLQDVEPPADLESRLIREIPLPTLRTWFTWSAGWMQGKAVSHGVAAAAGLLAAVMFYELSPGPRDISTLVGTLSRGNELAGAIQLSYLDIDLPQAQGRVILDSSDDIKLLRIDMNTDASIELEVDFGQSGLRFGGFAGSTGSESSSVSVSGQKFTISQEGPQEYSLILQDAPVQNPTPGSIEVGLSSNGESIYSGVISP